jgi:hypothetical protein
VVAQFDGPLREESRSGGGAQVQDVWYVHPLREAACGTASAAGSACCRRCVFGLADAEDHPTMSNRPFRGGSLQLHEIPPGLAGSGGPRAIPWPRVLHASSARSSADLGARRPVPRRRAPLRRIALGAHTRARLTRSPVPRRSLPEFRCRGLRAAVPTTGSGDVAPDRYLGLACGLGGLVGGYLGAQWRPRPAETALRLLLGALASALGGVCAVRSLR